MDTFKLLEFQILKLRMNNRKPRFVYLGKQEYSELKELAHRVTGEKRDVFMGVEVIRVNRNEHLNVTT